MLVYFYLAAYFLSAALLFMGWRRVINFTHDLEFWCEFENDKEAIKFISAGERRKEPLTVRRKKWALRNRGIGYIYIAVSLLLAGATLVTIITT